MADLVDLGPDLRAATHALVRTVDALPDDAWPAPSLLPGWSRAHVVAHLVLGAEALARVVTGQVEGEPVAMYPSPEARAEGLERLVESAPDRLREHLLGSTTEVGDALEALARAVVLDPAVASTPVERFPGSPGFLLGETAWMRLREVTVHHVDLDAGPGLAAWPAAFAATLLDQAAAQRVGDFEVAPDDDPRRWVVGAGGVSVSGPLRELGWWVTGRPAGDAVTSSSGTLPRTPAW